jgi:flagella basal body P-ring formation protein FlgA
MAKPLRAAPTLAAAAVPIERGDASASVVSLSAPKKRRPSWVLLGVVMVGLAALLGAYVFSTTSKTVSVLVAARDLSPGDVVTIADLRVEDVGHSEVLRTISPAEQGSILGQAARGPIPRGTLLNTGLFVSRDQVIPAGYVVVGVALDPGAVPVSSMAVGDRVEILVTAKAQTAGASGPDPVAVVATPAVIWSAGSTGQDAVSTKQVVSLLVPADTQATVAQAAADGRLRLSLSGSKP